MNGVYLFVFAGRNTVYFYSVNDRVFWYVAVLENKTVSEMYGFKLMD